MCIQGKKAPVNLHVVKNGAVINVVMSRAYTGRGCIEAPYPFKSCEFRPPDAFHRWPLYLHCEGVRARRACVAVYARRLPSLFSVTRRRMLRERQSRLRVGFKPSCRRMRWFRGKGRTKHLEHRLLSSLPVYLASPTGATARRRCSHSPRLRIEEREN